MERRPIGIFDSGVGGLTVLKAIRDRYPEEDFIYFGDTARVPYGTKSERTIIRYSLENAKLLRKFNVKLIVVACNTSSSYALDILKREMDIPVIGVVKPGAAAAVKATRTGNIGVIGTEATIKSGAYRREILSINPFLKIFEKPCPLFVPLIEEGWLDDEITYMVAERYLSELRNKDIDTLVLGCTHYPLLKNIIGKVCNNIKLVDSAEETALETGKLLNKREGDEKGEVRILVSDMSQRFRKIAEMIMGESFSIEEVSVDVC
ncbi:MULTISPECIES: glutamate racemase [unclassified Desulfurobacterium]|uniref:glutamate racemase n=1 Tax=unclassified Desulfurobacterium TaxID=2639089 RepID=UPI0003B3E185|nr:MULTISPECIES: glutamate racemase [unclassified Desulfurobacterium]